MKTCFRFGLLFISGLMGLNCYLAFTSVHQPIGIIVSVLTAIVSILDFGLAIAYENDDE